MDALDLRDWIDRASKGRYRRFKTGVKVRRRRGRWACFDYRDQ